MFSFDHLEGRRLLSGTFAATKASFEIDGVPGPSVRVAFNQDVDASTATTADLRLVNATTGDTVKGAPATDVAYDAAAQTVTWVFKGALPDGRYTAVLPTGSVSATDGEPMKGDLTVEFFSLAGDATRDAVVNLDDFNVVASNFGQSTRRFTQGDFNYDGVVNLTDFNTLAQNFGQSLPAKAPVRGDSSFGTDDVTKSAADDVLA
jgi:hypothetical protein